MDAALHLLAESWMVALTGAVLVGVLGAAVWLAYTGSTMARYFLWCWAGLLSLAAPVAWQTSTISNGVAGVILGGFLVVLYLTNRYNLERLEQSHEETRRVLAEANNRIDEERRNLSRKIHDDINPVLLLCRNELQRIKRRIPDEKDAAALERLSGLLLDAYEDARDLIRVTRIEVIDNIGLTAAIDALITQFSSCMEKPRLTLTHNLPAHPILDQDVALNAYKMIRELTLNAIKHAQAQEILVQLLWDAPGGKCHVTVADDGVGMGNSHHQSGGGIGMIDLRERARAIGTELQLSEAKPGRNHPGTLARFSFDLELPARD